MGVASNTLLTNDLITREAIRVLRNQFVLASRSARNGEDLFGKTGLKAGDTVRVRVPVRYVSATGAAIQKNDSTETNKSITLTQRNIGMGFISKDLTLSIDDFSDRFVKPAMAQLASDIDKDGFAAMMLGAENLTTTGAYSSGSPAQITGADVATLKPFLDAKARLSEKAVPNDDQLYAAVFPAVSAGLVDTLKTLFQSASEIAEQYKRGLMGLAGGMQFVESQTLPTHVGGTRTQAASPAVDGNQTGASILLKSVGNAVTVTPGDQCTIAGVYAINPLTRAATSKLQVFTVQNAETATVGGAVTIDVVPSINVTSPNQTVSAQAGNNAVVTWMGATAGISSDVNFVWHKDAMLCAFADLSTDTPGAESSKVSDPESGITLRLVQQYQVDTDEKVARIDVLYGWAVVRGSHICRVQG